MGSSDRRQYFETSGSESGFQSRTDHEGPEGEKKYRATLSLNSALERGGWLTLRPDYFPPRNDRVPIVRDGG
jgi:hypothetical protein